MKKLILCFILTFFILICFPQTKNIFPDIPYLTKSLKTICEKDNKLKNTFYVSSLHKDRFFLYWETQRRIYILDAIKPPSSFDYVVVIEYPTGGSCINLATDIVERPADIGTSTYLVDKKWVHEVIADCKSGVQIII